MNYEALALKWRPKDFASIVGQQHVVKALTQALTQQRLHHAYLFTGTRGVGKTTLARILAKSLNCIEGIKAVPCGVCKACQEIDKGCFIDYLEMDAASHRGVEEMGALLERAVYAPADARFKVYMIDEVHMLTQHAFNAMLKTLEEPPSHIKFILATTDPQKIPVTVLSRCLQFNLKQMPAVDIVLHLEKVLLAESIEFEKNALKLLAQAAQGSMRDALSLTDQAIAFSGAEIMSENVIRDMLGTVDDRYLIQILDAVLINNGAEIIKITNEMAMRSLSFSVALQDLSQLLHRIAWAQFAPNTILNEWPQSADIIRFAKTILPENVQLFYQIANIGRNELSLAPDEYAGFSMTLLRMMAFKPAENNPLFVKPKESIKKEAFEIKPEIKTEKPHIKLEKNENTHKQTFSLPSEKKVSDPLSPLESINLKNIGFEGKWTALASKLNVKGMAKQLAYQSELISVKEHQLTLQIAMDALNTKKNIEALETALFEFLNQKIKVVVKTGLVNQTVATLHAKKTLERARDAENEIESDVFVQSLMSRFDASILPGSIKSLANPKISE